MKEVVVTAGGTREKIDDVRYVGNFSSGRLGHAIAEVAAKSPDTHVTFIAPQSTVDRFGLSDTITHESFITSSDLRKKLLGIKVADIVFHSAAVADFIPEYTQGKISSSPDSLLWADRNGHLDKPYAPKDLTVRMTHNPKILSELREQFGAETTLVGFKLLSEATAKQLEDEAHKQICYNDVDFCVANDLQKITKESREIQIVEKTKGIYRIERFRFDDPYSGSTQDVAQEIYSRVTDRRTDYDRYDRAWWHRTNAYNYWAQNLDGYSRPYEEFESWYQVHGDEYGWMGYLPRE